MQALAGAKLDTDMRAIAENAMQHFASVAAEPSAAQIIDENQAEAIGGRGGMDTPTGMTVAPIPPEPYHPISPFRLKFSFGSDGNYSGVAIEDPKFLWNEPDEDGNPGVSLKTAGVGTISLNGTIYLNITLSGEDGAKKFASAQVSMSSDGDISIPLYQLDTTKGVVKDYRHALISLGIGGGGGSVIPDDVSTEFIPDPPSGTNPSGDEGKLQIKGFKPGTPADENTIAAYLRGTVNLPQNGIKLVCRWEDSDGAHILYLPLAALWSSGSGSGDVSPEIIYLDDVTWDPSSHTLVKHWLKKNIATGQETPVQDAPVGKTATISTTAISSIIN